MYDPFLNNIISDNILYSKRVGIINVLIASSINFICFVIIV